jgi:hypothetical protein
MKYLGTLAFLVVLGVQGILAQESVSSVSWEAAASSDPMSFPPLDFRTQLVLDQISRDQVLASADSFPRPTTRRLLPVNISWMEKGLWGEEGLLRTSSIAAPLTPESRASELSLRRGMLVAHQIGGFVTLGLMASAAYAGQKIIDGNSGYRPYHQAFVAGTIATYSMTGLLAVLSPPPVIRRDEISTTTIHKTLAWVHAIGMIVTPILGSMISRRASDTQKEHIHQLSGCITLTTYTASLITVTF